MSRPRIISLLASIALIFISILGRSQDMASSRSDAEHIRSLWDSAKRYESRAQLDSALHYHKKALKKSRELGLAEHQARSLLHISKLLKDTNSETSMEYLQNALDIANKLKHTVLKADIYYAMSGIHKQNQSYQEALAALEAHQKLLQATFLQNEENRIAHIRTIEAGKREQLILITILSAILILAGAQYWYYRKMKNLNRQLRDTNQIKDKLFSIIGHDLRGPAGGIMEALELVDTGVFTEAEQKEVIGLLKNQSRSFNDTLNSLFSWASTQLQGISPHKTTVHLKPLIEKNIAVLESQTRHKNININTRVEEDLAAFADANHIDFVIRNLLSNAIKFSYDGGVIDVQVTEMGNELVLSITDHGVGMSEEKQNQLMLSNNYMESSYGTKGEKGTGLGLTLCKEFVNENKGRLVVKSEIDKGSTFIVYLPAVEIQPIY